MRKPKKLDPKTVWIITDSNKSISLAFYHEDLAKAVLKELSKDIDNLELREGATSADGSFLDAVKVLSRENRWIDCSSRDKRYFQGLCEGWLTVPGATVPEGFSGPTGSSVIACISLDPITSIPA